MLETAEATQAAAVAPAVDGHAEMVAIASAFAPTDGVHATPVHALQIVRADGPGAPLPALYEPGLVLVLQGSKEALLDGEVLRYDARHCLVVAVTMLPRARIVEASAERPYLCLRIVVDPAELASLLLEIGPPPADDALGRGLRIARTSAPMLEAALRLLRLLRTPADLPVLAPLALREVLYRGLTGELGAPLRALAVTGSKAQRVARAIELLQQRYAEPLRIDEVAQAAHMSASSLHLHFKQVTSMSPVQFQKQLRLHQARRFMLSEGVDAATAAHRVGYESASQFSREYRRLFGAPPRAEIKALLGG